MANNSKYEDLGYMKTKRSSKKPAKKKPESKQLPLEEKQAEPAETASTGSELIRITGLWQSKTGALHGMASPTSKLLILPNEQKQKPSDPDYVAFWAKPYKQEEEYPF